MSFFQQGKGTHYEGYPRNTDLWDKTGQYDPMVISRTIKKYDRFHLRIPHTMKQYKYREVTRKRISHHISYSLYLATKHKI